MHRRAFLAGLVTCSGGAIAGCGSAGSSESAGYDIGMSASRFEPAELTVAVDQPVVWRNTNSRAHTVTAYEDGIPAEAAYFATGGYDSESAARDAFYDAFGGALASRDEYEHTFTVPGRYDYFCIPHEAGGMVGTVVVE